MQNEKALDSEFIEQKIAAGKDVRLYLINGVKLEGRLLKQDSRCLVMTATDRKSEQLVFKNSISTIT